MIALIRAPRQPCLPAQLVRRQDTANFVPVHGAWHGPWCWRDTATALRAAGHSVFTPTHSGVGKRTHQSAENITLETHIRDVCGCIVWDELSDVILVGHSHGGIVVTGVAHRLGARIKSLVDLDAFVPEQGASLIGLQPTALPPKVSAQFVGGLRGAALEGRSGLTQPIPAEVFNVAQANRAWVDRRCVPQALATFEMPLLLTGEHAQVAQRLYILADGWDPSALRHLAARFDGNGGWRVTKLPCGHDAGGDMPKEQAAESLRLA